MAQDGSKPHHLVPPAVTAIKKDAGVGLEPARVAMERTFSQDIQAGTLELKEAAEQSRNIILDLGLDGIIRWVSPSWTDVVGTTLETVKGKPIAQFITDNPTIFEAATAALKGNTAKSQFVKFCIKVGSSSEMLHMLPDGHQEAADEQSEFTYIELEGQGIMVYDRASGGESHTMWMLQPGTEPVCIEIALPQYLVDSLGIGAEILAKYLTELAEAGANDPEHHPPPLPILCRVCERSIVPWWFEKHSDLCVQEHKAEMDVQMIQDNLSEHRHAIVKVLDAFEARQGRSRSGESSPMSAPIPEYKGHPIGPSPGSSSAVSSRPASLAASPVRSQSPSQTALGHARARSFVVRRPLVRIVELILDLCDTALEISVPSIKDSKTTAEDEFQAQSPQSESRVSQVLQWQQPSSLENEPGLAALAADTEKLARAKVEYVHRHQFILEYAERIRQEYMAEVDACISEALIKAERAAAGESLSSTESESEGETPIETLAERNVQTQLLFNEEPETVRSHSYVGLKSMASALRNPRDMLPLARIERRSSSQAVSTGSSSPVECPTPKSHKSNLISHPQPISTVRPMYVDDGNESDGSAPSSGTHSAGNWRTDSPASFSDHGLGRTASSRDRKRRSMHLHGLGSISPHRQQSPGRYPLPPPSPLRMAKSRIPSGDSGQSPVVSPLLTAGEFMPAPSIARHHRRQSSMHSSDPHAPLSPKINSITHPQMRAQPPSIKDFEVIKPISRGAFGSVYLSKKKSTGEYFAIKVLRKSDMVAKNQVTNVKAERAIMMWQGESDFVAKLYWTFSSKDYLYLVMEYLNGGDCASLVKILGGLTEDWAKKYIAEVVLGVQHLHSRGIVHRDLKPDNLLIDSKGHLKLTDFGLSRMGLVGRQKRALKQPDDAPDLLKQGPFTQSNSNPPSRSTSFDFQHQNSGSPVPTPLMTPALAGGLDQPSYFNLNRESSLSRELSRKTSGYRSESGGITSHDLHHAFKNLGLQDTNEPQSVPHTRGGPIEEEAYSQGSASPDLYPLSQSMSNISQIPPPSASQMLPPPTALFDPEESDRRFVGTPDYLAPETINGTVQDEMCDWWSLGAIVFEFLYGYPPFNADSPEEVFDNILNRRIAWPDDEESPVSDEAKDLINQLIQLDPRSRLGSNKEEKYASGGAEIQAHAWFVDINWETLLEDEAQFIPNPEHPEDTEYFDARGATLSSFPEELEDQLSPPNTTPHGADYPDRPHDALFRAKTQLNSAKRGLMPLHIPPHVARDTRNRRLSEPVIADDFGNFNFKNLPVLEKANKDIVEKMRKEAMQAQSRGYSSQAVSIANTPSMSSPAPSLEGSPLVPMPVKRALSISKGHRPTSPSLSMNVSASPSRPSQPSSPLLVQFSTAQHHERRKTSSSSQSSNSLFPAGFFDTASDAKATSLASSPIKPLRMPIGSPAKNIQVPSRQGSMHSRTRSQTVGSQDSDVPTHREPFIPGHYKRKSQLFARDVSPSSSDNENVHAKALLKVQRRRQSSRRLSQINFIEGPMYRPLDVLIVEDHPVSKMVMEKLFEKLRCRTITASSGPEALRYAVSQIQFDIIFTEFKLPLINGVDIARMIRDTKSANTNTPIVCVTGYLRDLPDVHNFDTLMQKPPTVSKLTEELCKYCSWKPPPKDFKLTAPLTIPSNLVRHEVAHTQDSPSSIASSLAPTLPDSSWKGSSREDSISSGGFFSDMESVKADDIPLIVSRAGTDDWARSGLGITDDIQVGPVQKPYIHTSHPSYLQTESAPATAGSEEPPASLGVKTPRHQRSSEAIRSKREQIEKNRKEAGGPEEGDDEDDELGDAQVRAKSPTNKTARQSSKLGIEMLRTNSRGSVISMHDDGRYSESESLRRSLELLEERIESLKIPEEADANALLRSQPRKTEKFEAQHSHPSTDVRPPSQGHITPPIIFPQKPGHMVADMVMENKQPPMPRVEDEADTEPTPKSVSTSSNPPPRNN